MRWHCVEEEEEEEEEGREEGRMLNIVYIRRHRAEFESSGSADEKSKENAKYCVYQTPTCRIC